MSDDERYIRAILAGCFWAGRDSPTQVRNVDIETREQTVQAWLGLDHRWDDLTEGERADRILERIDTKRSSVEGTPQLLVDDLISTVVSSYLTMTPSEIEDFYSLDNQLWTLVVEQGQQELLPSRDVLSRELDHLKHGGGSPMRPVQFEGKCNLPGDWSEGEYDVVPNRWLREMFALRSALMTLSNATELSPTPELLSDQLVDEADVPAEFRLDGTPNGKPLTPQLLKQENWGLTSTYITEAYDNKDILNIRIQVRTPKRGRNPYAYRYDEMLQLRERKTNRENQKEEQQRPKRIITNDKQ